MAPGFPLLVHEPLGSAGAYLSVPAERGIHRAGRHFRRCVFVGVGVGRVLLSDGASSSSVLPRAKPGLGGPGSSRLWPWARPGLDLLRERVESLIRPSPGRGEMTVGGVSIAPARRSVPGHAQPAGQLPHRVPVELHPGTLGRWGFISRVPSPGVPPRLPSGPPFLPAHVFGLFCCPERAGRQPGTGLSPGPPTVSTNALDSIMPFLAQMPSWVAQPLIPATGSPECLCGTSGSARWPRTG